MAYRGAWRPVLEFLAAAIARQSSIRDYIEGEKVIQGFLAAYLSCTDHFVFHSERELGGGYADICLEPHLLHYTGMRHGYVIEFSSMCGARSQRARGGWRRRRGKRRRSCGATWRTNAWRVSTRRCASPVWLSCSMAGSWCAATP